MKASSEPERPDDARPDKARPDEVARDPLAAYVAGDPDAVRAAAPREPTTAEWEATRRQIHARLARGSAGARRTWPIWAACGVALSGIAAAVAWVAFNTNLLRDNSQSPDVVEIRPGKPVEVAPPPHEARPDPLAEFAVLPMAGDDDVVFHRVPGGDGWFPVGVHPLAGVISLATADEVQLDDPDLVWPHVVLSPGDAPMIFATKPR